MVMPLTKNFILYDKHRQIIHLPAEYYGEAMKVKPDGFSHKVNLSVPQLESLQGSGTLDDPMLRPLAKYGLVAESIHIPSTTRNINFNNNESWGYISVGKHNKSARPPIRVIFKLFASDSIDFSMKVSEYRAFLNNLEEFYIADARQPFKLYKVMINQEIEFEQPQYHVPYGECALGLVKVESIYGESLHTTQTIDREGVLFNGKWAYGMGTLFDEDSWCYSFFNQQPRFYNAGTEEVKLIQQKESAIELKINQSASWFEIVDGKGTVFRLNKAVSTGDVLRIIGSEITLNGNNVIGDTNYNFLIVSEGWNRWEVRNVDRYEFKIDFRFLYD